MRTGLIAQKVGMTRWLGDRDIPVTVLKMDACQVTAIMTVGKHGYSAVQLGAGVAKANRVAKPQRDQFSSINIEPKQTLVEFRVSEESLLEVGSELCVSHFVEGQYVDVTATTQGKGFQGGIKRWNFGGLRATHGVSISHRSIGSTGQNQDPGRVFKNKKMPGQMGNKKRTVQNLCVVAIDVEKGLILVEGAVPGHKGAWVTIKDAVKKVVPDSVPRPAGLKAAVSVVEGTSSVEERAEASAE